VLCFNDDIQGTAAVTLAAILASTRVSGRRFRDLRIMFLGAGSAATGIADLTAAALTAEGLDPAEARGRLSFVDQHGLLVKRRTDLLEHNAPYVLDREPLTFLEAIDALRPDVLIGATGVAGVFTREAIERMAAIRERPAIFALSNPTSKAECTAEQACRWSGGRAIFASGSPFAAVTFDGRTSHPSQANNAYVFPGIGLGAIACRARTLPDDIFLTAARTLASLVRPRDLERGALFPPLADIRRISLAIAERVALKAYDMRLARRRRPDDVRRSIEALMYDPSC
jgi:malate dehydrogenase (oxaloacetate-decarboxylating)(NADP+)